MANGYSVKIDSIVSDGTNLYMEVSISNGATTFPKINPIFSVDTTAAAITAYIQSIATAGPTLTSAIADLVGSRVTG